MTLIGVERAVEQRSDEEILASLGLKIETLRGRRVLIFGTNPELIKIFENANLVAEAPNKKISFEVIDQENTIKDEAQLPLKLEAEDGSADFILDIRTPDQLPENAYTIESYREIFRVMKHRGRIIISDPLGKRAFPIEKYLDEKYRQYQEDPGIAERTEKIAPVVKKMFSQRYSSSSDSANNFSWWEIINEMVEEECRGENDEGETLCEELILNLSSGLEKEFDYRAVVELRNRERLLASSKTKIGRAGKKSKEGSESEEDLQIDQNTFDPGEVVLTVEKSSFEVETTFAAAHYIQDNFDIELDISELRALREIVSKLLIDMRKFNEYFLMDEEGKSLKRGYEMASPMIESVSRFLSSAYKVEIANDLVSLIAKKIDYRFPIEATMITISKFLSVNGKNYLVEEREFDLMECDSYKAMNRKSNEYRNCPVDRKKIEEFAKEHNVDPETVKTVTKTKRSVSRELKEIIQKRRESVIK
jgi:SAM-dependent methyltransferase